MGVANSLERYRYYHHHAQSRRQMNSAIDREKKVIYNELAKTLKDRVIISIGERDDFAVGVCEDRLRVLMEEIFSVKDDREEIMREYQQIMGSSSILGNIKLPVKVASLNIAQMNSSNIHTYVLHHTIDHLYHLLYELTAGAEGQYDQDTVKDIRVAYETLNNEDLYYNTSLLVNTISAGNTVTRNITTTMRRVLEAFQKEKAKVQQRFERLRELAQSSSNNIRLDYLINGQTGLSQTVTNPYDQPVMSVDNVYHFKQVFLGSESDQALGTSYWVCGNPSCGQKHFNEVPLLLTNSQVFQYRLAPEKVSALTTFNYGFCDECESYNILPGSYMDAIVQVLAIKSNDLGANISSLAEGFPVVIGQGIYDQARIMLEASAAEEEDFIRKAAFEEDLTDLPDVVSTEYETITTFPQLAVEDYIPLLLETQREMLAALVPASTGILDSEAIKDATVTDNFLTLGADTELSADLQNLREVYGDRLLVNSQGQIKLVPSKLFVGFAKMFLGSSTEFGYTTHDLLISICNVETVQYAKLLQYQEYIELELTLRKLRGLILSTGSFLGSGYAVSADKLSSLYDAMLHQSNTVFTVLGADYPIYSDMWEGLDLTPVMLTDSDALAREEEIHRHKELEELNITNSDISLLCERYLKIHLDRVKTAQMNFPQCCMTGKMLTLLAYCDVALDKLQTILKDLETEIVEMVSWEADMKDAKIGMAGYTYSPKSPIHVLSPKLKNRLIEAVYFRMLKNTLTEVSLADYFCIPAKNTQDPYSAYNKEIKRIRGIFSQFNVPNELRIMFCTYFHQAYERHIGSDKDSGGWLDLETTAMGSFDTKLSDAVPVSAYYSFISELWCNIANSLVDPRMCQSIFYLNSSVLLDNEHDVTIDEGRDNGLVSLVYCAPEISEEFRLDTLAYLINCEAIDTSGIISAEEVPSDLWSNEDAEEDPMQVSRKIDVLTNLLFFYQNYLSEEAQAAIISDLERYEMEEA